MVLVGGGRTESGLVRMVLDGVLEVTDAGGQLEVVHDLVGRLAEERPLLHDVGIVVIKHDAVRVGVKAARVRR